MSRKDYEKVAAIINRLSRKPGMPQILVGWLIAEFVLMFEADNPRFVSSRFIEAPGVSAVFSINRVAVDFSEAKKRSKSDMALTIDNLMRFIKSMNF